MNLSRNRLYGILAAACIAGYVWLYINLTGSSFQHSNEMGTCMIKHITNIPCPSCGSTRSVVSILNGNLLEAWNWNPLGFLLFFMITVIPIWILVDIFKKDQSLFLFYKKAETILQQKAVAIPAILLIVVNWFWNIYKDL